MQAMKKTLDLSDGQGKQRHLEHTDGAIVF